MQQVNVAPQGGRGNQISGGVNPWSGHPRWCQGVKSHLKSQEMLTSLISSQGSPCAMISKEEQPLCLIFPAREREAYQIHTFIYIYLHMAMEQGHPMASR